jgi:DNA-binding IclR family transcriptional regulator
MLAKGLSLLMALGTYPDGVGVSELARKVGLPVSTTHRLLWTMIPLNFVNFDSKRRQYFLGLKAMELSHMASRRISEAALPVMRRISEATKEPTFMAVLDGAEMVHVEAIEGAYPIQVRRSVGERGPLYCTSLGKALLAFLPEEERETIIGQLTLKPYTPNTIIDPDELRKELYETRERGYAVSDEEHEEGVHAVGVPVISGQGWPVAAISTPAPASRVSREDLEHFVPWLKDAAREIGLRLPAAGVRAQL